MLEREFGELIQEIEIGDVIDFVELLPGCIARNPSSWAKFLNIIKDSTISITQKIPIYKLGLYISGIKQVEDNLGKACELSNKLFGEEKTRVDNGLRLYKYVTETETNRKIEMLIDAARAFLLAEIGQPMFFRIYKAIAETLPEDLLYLSGLVEEYLTKRTEIFQGNTEIIALAQQGLMIVAGDDGNKGVEEQDYAITTLGFMVDRYALSYNDEERQNLYKKCGITRL